MIDHNPDFSIHLNKYFNKYNIKTKNYEDPYLALTANLYSFDLIILELNLLGLDGIKVCKKISQKNNIPIIVTSARNTLKDRIDSLNNGANYFLSKPYSEKELYAIIQSLLRRDKKINKKNSKTFKLDIQKSQVIFENKELKLTCAEYEVMKSLLKNKNAIVSREQLVYESMRLSNSYSKSLDVIIGRLRRKLNDNPKKPKYIQSIRGIGYKINQ